MRTKIFENFYLGDEPEGFIYPGEKEDKLEIEYRIKQIKYEEQEGLTEIERLESLEEIVSLIVMQKLKINEIIENELDLHNPPPFEGEPLSEQEKEEIVWDMKGAELLIKAKTRIGKHSAIPKYLYRYSEEDCTKSHWSEKRTKERRHARRVKNEFLNRFFT